MPRIFPSLLPKIRTNTDLQFCPTIEGLEMPFDAGKVVVGQSRAARRCRDNATPRRQASRSPPPTAGPQRPRTPIPWTPKVEPPCAWPSASFQGSECGELCKPPLGGSVPRRGWLPGRLSKEARWPRFRQNAKTYQRPLFLFQRESSPTRRASDFHLERRGTAKGQPCISLPLKSGL